jgi:ABC-type multidrug transport system permease subunit
MNNILNLIKGEIIRLVKYRIIFFGILVSLIWILIVAFQTPEQAKGLIPLLVVTDSGMMAIILIGAGFYYEKQENTIKSVLVSPVSLSQVLISKIVSAVVMAFISVIVVVGSAIIIHGISVSIFELILYVLVVVISHTGLGYIVILKSPDFLAMLVKLSGLILIFYLPTLLVILKIIPENLEIFCLLSPPY